jgi:hypothetical protein
VLVLPARKTTLLQGNDITPGDFFKHWAELKHELKEKEHKYALEAAALAGASSPGGSANSTDAAEAAEKASHLSSAAKLPGAILLSMLKREANLFSNPLLLAAVLADPRTFYFVSGDDTKQYYLVSSHVQRPGH